MADVVRGSAEGGSARIDGWKRIAAFLERDKSTVKRWESYRGLPVRRLPGPRAPVFAFKHELLAWMAANRDAEFRALTLAEPAAARDEAAPRAERRNPIPIAAALAMLILGAAVWAQQLNASAPREAPDPTAAVLYQRARAAYELRTPAGFRSAMADFKAAVARDPQFAAAYAGLADTWLLMPEYTTVSAQRTYPEAEAAAKTALRLDPVNAAAHAALGFELYWWKRDLGGARAQFATALRLAPNDAQTHVWLANILNDADDGAAALAEIDRASALNPASASIAADRGFILAHRDPHAGVQLLRDLVTLQPNNRAAHYFLAYFALPAGRDEDYLDNMQRVAQLMGDPARQAFMLQLRADYARGGRRALLEALLADAEKRDDALQQAHMLAQLGRDDEAMASLRRAISHFANDQGNGLATDPYFTDFRRKPEFRALFAASVQGGNGPPRQPIDLDIARPNPKS